MSSLYSTIQQHEPLKVPSGWTGDQKRLVLQLEEILDDLYSRFNRLDESDLSASLRNKISQISTLDDRVTQAESDIEQSAEEIALRVTRSEWEGDNVTRSETAPTNPATGDWWLDTSEDPYVLKQYNGTEWVDTEAVEAQAVHTSGVDITSDAVDITTENFRVNIGSSTSTELTVDKEGVYAKTLAGEDIEGLPAARRYTGEDTLTVTDMTGIGALFKNRQLDHDVTVKLNYTVATELADTLDLTGLSGSGKLTITNGDDASGHNVTLQGGITVTDCECRIEFRYITANYTITRSPKTLLTDCSGSGSGSTVTKTVEIPAYTTAYYSTYGGGFSADRSQVFQGNSRYAACAWFDLSSVPSGQGVTISNVSVRFRRKSQGGTTGVAVGNTSTCAGPSASFSVNDLTQTGATGSGSKLNWITLSETASVAEALRTGCYVLWTADSGSQYYMDLSGSSSSYPPVLTLTYSYSGGSGAYGASYADTFLPAYLASLGQQKTGSSPCTYVTLGSVTIACGSGTASSSTTPYTAAYAGLFESAPTVVATWGTTGANDTTQTWGTIKVFSITENGFWITAAGNYPSTAKNFQWVAIGPTKEA